MSFTNIGFTNIAGVKIDEIKLKSVLLLDNQSAVNIVCNPALVKNIRQAPDCMTVMMVDGGKLSANKKANLIGCGEVWFDERAITNRDFECLTTTLETQDSPSTNRVEH